MNHPPPRPGVPASVMVWSLPDTVLEDRPQLEEQFDDLCRAGFDGVAAFVRCSRYSWADAPARSALAWITEASRRVGLDCWIVPDPRLVSRYLIGTSGGLSVLLFGDAARAIRVPHTAPIERGRYSLRCTLGARHVHMLTEVAVEFVPRDLVRVYAIRRSGGALASNDVVDLTRSSHLFYNARDRYVEAFGHAPALDGNEWEVVAFIQADTNHVDFSSADQMVLYERLLGKLARSGVRPSGVLWDEPGFTCTYGTLPYAPAHRRAFRRATGAALESVLWKLAFDAKDGSHVPVRCAYYGLVRESIVRAQARMQRRGRTLWGRTIVTGMHDTWHFESADMCDMNHGSLDLWAGLRSKSAGFVDLGGIDALRDDASPWYANLAAMNVMASTLGKFSRDGRSYNNLWTVGDDDGSGWQREVMDHCVTTMELFGLRWLAHAYGPVGTVGEERSFLGSPPLPGYPEHSTWPAYPQWNARLRSHCALVEDRLPKAHLLVLFPVESLYALADRRADKISLEVFQLILALLDRGYHIDVLSPRMAGRGRWAQDGFVLGRQHYDAVVYPFGHVVPEIHAGLFHGAGNRILVAYDRPRVDEHGRAVRLPQHRLAPTRNDLLAALESFPSLRPVRAPEHTWTTVTETTRGTVVCIAPSRYGRTVEGRLAYGTREVELGQSRGLVSILFAHDGDVHIL